MAVPEVAAGDHIGSTGEGERVLFQLEVAAGGPYNMSESPPGVARFGGLCSRLGPLDIMGVAAGWPVPSAACSRWGAGGGTSGRHAMDEEAAPTTVIGRAMWLRALAMLPGA